MGEIEMNKDFWERIGRLEELANKVNLKDWECTNDFGKPALIANNGVYGVQIAEAVFAGKADDIEYIAAANPAMILEMIAELKMLEKEADWLASELRSWEYDQALPGDNIPGIKEFRELARKTVSEADNA